MTDEIRRRGDVIALGSALGFEMPTLSDEEWARRDAEVLARRASEEADARAERESAKIKRLTDAGFPLRAVDAARSADENRAVIQRIKGWDHATKSAIVLAGAPGCGKTVAATWWALRQNWPPMFLRATSFAASSRYDRDDRKAWFAAGALVLDDLGTEFLDAKGSFLVDLDELLDVFYGDRKPLVITTNVDVETFRQRYGARVVDRLRECGTWFECRERSGRGAQ